MTFFKRLRADSRKEKLEAAVRKHAAAQGDAEFHRLMTDYYTGLATTIDHTRRWWEYADAKQKESDNMTLFQKYSAQAAEFGAKLIALQESMK